MCRGADAFLNQVVGGRWRLLQVLGATAHGAAFRVETLEDGRPARMELWDQHHVEGRGEQARFEREARTLSRLRHERCVSIVAFGAHEGRPFLVSDLPAGASLRDQLGKPELTVRRALAVGLQLCEGLVHLHGHGVVHRALLPDNVWVAEGPAADSLKIGLPRFGQTAEGTDAARERFYLPPERSATRLDHRADLYAAGMLLYVMCTGREPAREVFATAAGGESLPPPRAVSPERGISEALERVILRAVAPSPKVRFGTADELMAALQSVGARPTSPKRRPAGRSRERTAMLAAAFVAVAVLGAGALHSSGRQGSSAPPAAPAAQLPTLAEKPPAPPPPRPVVAAAAPPLEPAAQPAARAVAPPAPHVAAMVSGAPSDAERSEIWSLLDSGRLDEGAARIKPLVAKDPDAAWPRFALGVLESRRYWRRDAVKQWRLALAQDADIRHDPQFGAYLCFMLDDAWKAAGVTDLLSQLGPRAVPLLDRCVASAKTPRLRALATRARDRFKASVR